MKCRWGRNKNPLKNRGKTKHSSDAVPNGKYCQTHGCSFCFNHKGKEIGGIKVCKTPLCNKKWEEQKKEELAKKEQQNLKNKQQEIDKKLEEDIKSISPSFYEKLEETLTNVTSFKHLLIERDISVNHFSVSFHQPIENCSSLKTDEKMTWKSIYKEVKDANCLPNTYLQEKNFLTSLAQKYKDSQERERERINLIHEIKSALNNSPVVDVSELENKFHSYESLILSELISLKSELLTAISDKQAEKKLTDLLNRAHDSSDDELWSFIQQLEEFNSPSASPHQNNAYSTHQDKANTILNKLRQRWDNLDEEQKLTNYWTSASHKFANWIKEAENLHLAVTDPFYDFVEDIKNYKTKAAIEQHEKEAYQHILAQFKEVVKQSLGTEEKSGEYQTLDQAQDFTEVKLARNNIKWGRQKSDIPYSPSPEDNNYLPSPSPKNPNDNGERGPGDKNDELPSNLTEIKQIIQDKIESLLTNLGFKNKLEFCKDLLKGEECWKKYLWKLADKEKVIDFSHKIEKRIREEINQRKLKSSLDNQEKKFPFFNILIILVCFIFFFLAAILAKKSRRKFMFILKKMKSKKVE